MNEEEEQCDVCGEWFVVGVGGDSYHGAGYSCNDCYMNGDFAKYERGQLKGWLELLLSEEETVEEE